MVVDLFAIRCPGERVGTVTVAIRTCTVDIRPTASLCIYSGDGVLVSLELMVAFLSAESDAVVHVPFAIGGSSHVEPEVDTVSHGNAVEHIRSFIMIVLVEALIQIIRRYTVCKDMSAVRPCFLIASAHLETIAVSFVVTVLHGPAVIYDNREYRIIEVPSVIRVVP